MWLDLLLVAILGVFVLLGAVRGALASAASLLTLGISYAAGVYGATHFGGPLGDAFALPALLAVPVAGSLAFLVTFVVCGALAAGARRWERRRRDGEPRSFGDRIGGGVFGAVRGGLIVLLLAVLASWVDAARDLGVAAGFEAAPEVDSSLVVGLTGSAVEASVGAAFSDAPGGRVAARIAAHPGQALGGLQGLLSDERIRRLQEDQLFWSYVGGGAVDTALNRASFWTVVHDDELRGQLADLGLVSADAASDPAIFREDVHQVLGEVGPRIRGLKNDPEMHALARNPEVVRLLESGDAIGLLRHPDFQKLLSRVTAEL